MPVRQPSAPGAQLKETKQQREGRGQDWRWWRLGEPLECRQPACLKESRFSSGGMKDVGPGREEPAGRGEHVPSETQNEHGNLPELTLKPLPDHPVSVRVCGEPTLEPPPSPTGSNMCSFSLTLPEAKMTQEEVSTLGGRADCRQDQASCNTQRPGVGNLLWKAKETHG